MNNPFLHCAYSDTIKHFPVFYLAFKTRCAIKEVPELFYCIGLWVIASFRAQFGKKSHKKIEIWTKATHSYTIMYLRELREYSTYYILVNSKTQFYLSIVYMRDKLMSNNQNKPFTRSSQ